MADGVEVADVTTPIGTFRIAYEGPTVRVVDLLENGLPQSGVPGGAIRRRPPFGAGTPPAQLRAYFHDASAGFDLRVAPESGSDFDRTVWEALRRVPRGKTITYGELARRAGFPGAARAVGGAMARNPIPIVIPCHRVVGEGGSMRGFGLGLWRKRWLLDHEGSWPLKSRSAEGPRPGGQRTLDTFDPGGRTRRGPKSRRTRSAAEGGAG